MGNLATIVTRCESLNAPYGIVLGGLSPDSEKASGDRPGRCANHRRCQTRNRTRELKDYP